MRPLSPPRLRPRLAALLLALAAGCSRPASTPEETAPPATVKWQIASENKLKETTELVGTTVPLPQRVARITSAVEGRVVDVLPGPKGDPLTEGKRVKKGTVLVKLDTTIINANLAKLKANQDVYQEDQKQAQIALDLANVEVDRLRKLKDEDGRNGGRTTLVSPVVLEKADLALKDAQSKLKGSLGRLVAGEKEIDALQKQLQYYSIATPIEGRLGRIQVMPGQTISVGTPVADVIDVEDQIDVLCFVPSSMLGLLVKFKLTDQSLESLRADGVPAGVLEKLKALKDEQEKEEEDEGTYQTRDQFAKGLARALDADELKLKPDELDRYRDLIFDRAWLRLPARTVAESDASGTAGVEAEGRIEYVAEQAEPETGNFAVKVRLSNAEAHLRANRVVRVAVETRPSKVGLNIPESAISEDEVPPTVVVVDQIKTVKDKDNPAKEDTVGVAHRVQVTLGIRDRKKGQVEVLGLFDPEKDETKKWKGDVKSAQFVVEGGQGLQSGDAVKLDVDTD